MENGLTNKKYKMKRLIHFLVLSIFVGCISSCEDEIIEETKPQTDSIADIDGNVYTIVKIGDNWWMAEDLKVKKYRNGDLIEESESNASWAVSNAAYCLFDGNAQAPGLLYNWEAVNHSSGLAPEGWHVATESEWQELERHLEMNAEDLEKYNWRESGNCGDKLKVKGPQSWLGFDNVWGNNSSGFTALTTGCRLDNGNWSRPGLGSCGFWWTATEKEHNTAFFRNLDYKKSGVFRFHVNKRYGMAVRCVKNK